MDKSLCLLGALLKNKPHKHWHAKKQLVYFLVCKQHKSLGYVLLLAVNFPPQQLVKLNRCIFLRSWHVRAQKLQTEQSAFQTNPPPPLKWQKAPQCGKSLAGSSLALLISIWQHVGSLWLNVARSVNAFLLDGFPALPLQSCVAGDDSPPSLTPDLHFLPLLSSASSLRRRQTDYIQKCAHIKF